MYNFIYGLYFINMKQFNDQDLIQKWQFIL